MDQFNIGDEIILAGSHRGSRPIADLPETYSEFLPSSTSERKGYERSKEHADIPIACLSPDQFSNLLDDMNDVISFAKHRLLKPRMEILASFRDNIENKKCVLEAGVNSLDALDLFIKVTIDNLSSFIYQWEKRKRCYSEDLYLVCDTDNPSPNLNILPRCPGISQHSYVDLLKKMVQLCCMIENGLRSDELKLNNMDVLCTVTRKKLQQLQRKVSVSVGKVESMFEEEYAKIYCMLEQAEGNVNLLKREWQKGDSKATLATPRLYTVPYHSLSDENWVPPKCPLEGVLHQQPGDLERPFRSPRSARQAATAEEVDTPTQIGSLAAAIFRRGLQPVIDENKPKIVENIVYRYNHLQNTVRDEMRNISNQLEMISKSEAALEKRPTY